ncbi:MAG: guanine permease [Gemmatimonadetes bacterium]|nr:guanine permease [Gemmatimonadota bacterium]
MLERFFRLDEHNTTPRTELLAGLTTFLTMLYIVFVNPTMLAEAGMDRGAVFVATCLAAAIGTLLMGVLANYPIALAPGMGLNAYFAYTVVLGMGHPWQTALGAVFISGCIFVLLSVFKVRMWLIDAIPPSLKLATSTGIGLFLAVIAFQSAGVIADSPATLITLGDLGNPRTLLACLGFVLMVALDVRRVPGAIVIGILTVTGVAALLGLTQFEGVFAPPPDIRPTFLAMDIRAAFDVGLITIVFAFLFVDLLDTAGTLVGVAHGASMLDRQGRLPRLGPALLADSSATVLGATLGTSTTTSYIESVLGVQAGGRTGLTALTVSLLFLLALFLAPLAQSVPPFATAPALLYVACTMARGFASIDWSDATEASPALVTALGIALTLSIATGIGLGFLAFTAIKLLTGRGRDVTPGVLVLSILFLLKFSLL